MKIGNYCLLALHVIGGVYGFIYLNTYWTIHKMAVIGTLEIMNDQTLRGIMNNMFHNVFKELFQSNLLFVNSTFNLHSLQDFTFKII